MEPKMSQVGVTTRHWTQKILISDTERAFASRNIIGKHQIFYRHWLWHVDFSEDDQNRQRIVCDDHKHFIFLR